MRLYTIGHSTRSFAEFVDLLTGAQVSRLVDVRRFPHSRRHPQFDGETLADTLRPYGIGYCHAPDLGGRRGPAQGRAGHPNDFWRNRSFRNYADHAMGPSFQAALAALLDLAQRETCALMCAEALWWRCHRRIIADYLIHHGAEVIHIMGQGRPAVAELTHAAVPRDDGTLAYPG